MIGFEQKYEQMHKQKLAGNSIFQLMLLYGIESLYYDVHTDVTADQTVSIFGLLSFDSDSNMYIMDTPIALINTSDLSKDISQISLGFAKQFYGIVTRSLRFALALFIVCWSGKQIVSLLARYYMDRSRELQRKIRELEEEKRKIEEEQRRLQESERPLIVNRAHKPDVKVQLDSYRCEECKKNVR